jgi:hypothetical protein
MDNLMWLGRRRLNEARQLLYSGLPSDIRLA